MNFAKYGIDTKGKTHGEIKALCPECSAGRKKKTQPCLNVNLDTGLFHCWHCEYSGKATDEAQTVNRSKAVAYTKPTYTPEPKAAQDMLEWFKTRGISEQTVSRNKISKRKAWMPQLGKETGAIAFPYFRGTECINIKYRDREKNFKMESGAERILYGLNDIAERTVIVEGEMDKLAMEEAGIVACVSVPDGAPAANTKNFDNKFDFLNSPELETVKQWVIAVDSDAPGQRLQAELVRRFGSENCLIVSWPDGCKDANDVLLAYSGDVLAKMVNDAVPVPIVGVFTASELASELFDLYESGLPRGAMTGWHQVDEFYTCMPGQLNIVTGIPGHGKSELVDALTVNLAHLHGWRIAFYSPENFPVKLHVAKIAEKYLGKPFNAGRTERMSKADFASAMDWIDGHFKWIMPESPSLDEILDKARALVARDGIRVLVIDPWNEVEHDRPSAMSETEYISLSLSRLRKFARKHEVAIFVIAHPKLMSKDKDGFYPVPSPYDISGSANWRNKADNCLTVWRDLHNDEAPVELHIQKIKFKIVGKLGKVDLRYDRVTGRYFDAYPTPAPMYDRKKASANDVTETVEF
jgi:twinkle protein